MTLRYILGSTIASIMIMGFGIHVTSDPVANSITDTLPPPYSTKSVRNHPRVIGLPEGAQPSAPAGLTVSAFATELKEPRWASVAEHRDVFVSASSSG